MTSTTQTFNSTRSDETTLIHEIVGGRSDRFGDLIAPHIALLTRFVRATIGDHPDIEDIVQQAVLKAFTQLRQFRFEAGFRTWLFRIGLNEARQWRRRIASSKFLELTPTALTELPIPDQRHSPLTEYQRTETMSRLQAAIAQLPKKYQSVIVLRDFEEASISEVAGRLGLTIPAVKTRHRRARQRVATLLGVSNRPQHRERP